MIKEKGRRQAGVPCAGVCNGLCKSRLSSTRRSGYPEDFLAAIIYPIEDLFKNVDAGTRVTLRWRITSVRVVEGVRASRLVKLGNTYRK